MDGNTLHIPYGKVNFEESFDPTWTVEGALAELREALRTEATLYRDSLFEDGSRPNRQQIENRLRNLNDEGDVCLDWREVMTILDEVLGEETDGPRLHTITADQLKSKRIEWFLPERIPLRTFCLLEGEGGLGKSLIALDLLARGSRGAKMPDGSPGIGKFKSLFFASEDNTSILKQRLQAAGADLTQITLVSSVQVADSWAPFTLPNHVEALEEKIVRTGARFVYIDSLFDTLALGLDTNKARDVRAALSPLRDVANRTGAVILATRHVNKTPGRASTRGLGSADFVNVARAVLSVAIHPSESEKRLVSVAKQNYGKPCDSLAFVIQGIDVRLDDGHTDSVPRIKWLGTDATTADEATLGVASKRDAAKAALLDALSRGPVKAQDLAQTIPCSRDTLFRAREELKASGHAIRARKDGLTGGWTWYLDTTGQVDAFEGDGREE